MKIRPVLAATLCAAVIIALAFTSILEAQDTNEEKGEILYWTCGMHPSVHAEEPGKCPICNMDLVPVLKEPSGAPPEEGGREEFELRVSPDAVRLARIKTVEVVRRVLTKTIRATGEVTYDESRTAVIAARVGGRIEKLFADYTGKKFRAGEPLALIYSPELLSAQQEYLLARDTELATAARRKLTLWGITDKQIHALDESGELQTNLAIHAPIGGTVIHKSIVEGLYVTEGTTLFHMADLSRVWILADIFEHDLGAVGLNQEALITSDAFPGETMRGRITFIDPFLNQSTRSVKVRIEIKNPGEKFLPGMFVTVEIQSPVTTPSVPSEHEIPSMSTHRPSLEQRPHSEGDMDIQHAGHEHVSTGEGQLVVPRSAVINTGRRAVAFVEIEEGRYLMRLITLGPLVEGHYVVLEGLAEGERVVERGSFLLDSQTQLTGEAEQIYGGALGKESEKIDPHQQHRH